MPLVAPHGILVRAFRERWALGAFNTSNLEVTQAIAWALRDARAPGIIQTSEAAIRYAGLETLRDIVRDVADSVSVPIVLHLDHGKSYETVEACIDAGYSSVMIDGSALPFEQNVALTKRVVDLAHGSAVWVEAELGLLPGKEGIVQAAGDAGAAFLTDPAEATEFVRSTGVDALAVSVGTAHGAYRGAERIRFDRLTAIHAAVPIPLVLHGGSGLPNEDVRRALGYGIAKVNVDTELREAFHDVLAEHREEEEGHTVDPRAMLGPARDAILKVVRKKVALFRSAGKSA